jgi:hypothetical protein
MLANWVKQNLVSTGIGIGELVLDTSIPSYIRFSSAFSDGETVNYSIIYGEDRENGIGTYVAAGNKITRDTVLETLVAGAYSNAAPSPLNLEGIATVGVSPTTQGLTNNFPIWKEFTPSYSTTGYTIPSSTAIIAGILAPAYDPTTMNELGFTFVVPHDVMPSESMVPCIRWSPVDGTAGIVRWGIEYTAADVSLGVFDTTVIDHVEQAAAGVTGTHQYIEFAAHIPAFPPNSVITGRIFRDAANGNDTYAGAAHFTSIGLKYLSDRIGTPGRESALYDWT